VRFIAAFLHGALRISPFETAIPDLVDIDRSTDGEAIWEA
jgi:hypothetical protein